MYNNIENHWRMAYEHANGLKQILEYRFSAQEWDEENMLRNFDDKNILFAYVQSTQ